MTLILTDIPPVLLSATHMQIQTEANIPNPYIQRKDFTPTNANTNSNNTQRQSSIRTKTHTKANIQLRQHTKTSIRTKTHPEANAQTTHKDKHKNKDAHTAQQTTHKEKHKDKHTHTSSSSTNSSSSCLLQLSCKAGAATSSSSCPHKHFNTHTDTRMHTHTCMHIQEYRHRHTHRHQPPHMHNHSVHKLLSLHHLCVSSQSHSRRDNLIIHHHAYSKESNNKAHTTFSCLSIISADNPVTTMPTTVNQTTTRADKHNDMHTNQRIYTYMCNFFSHKQVSPPALFQLIVIRQERQPDHHHAYENTQA